MSEMPIRSNSTLLKSRKKRRRRDEWKKTESSKNPQEDTLAHCWKDDQSMVSNIRGKTHKDRGTAV